jgi:hypothetical protein
MTNQNLKMQTGKKILPLVLGEVNGWNIITLGMTATTQIIIRGVTVLSAFLFVQELGLYH